jgi:hypothetical protein
MQPFLPKWENGVLLWEFKLKSALAAARTWYFKRTLRLKYNLFLAKNGKMPQITGDTAHLNYCISVTFKVLLLFHKPTSYFLSAAQFPFLGMLTKLQKCYVMSIHLSDHLEQLCSHWMNFH